MVRNGPNDHFGQNGLIPNWISAFARPKWTKMVHFGLGSYGPGKLTEKGKFPKVLRGGCKRSFGPREQRSPKSLLYHPKLLLHRCKMGFGWCKRLFGDLCSLGPQDLLHPPLSTFGNFPFSVNFPGPQLPKFWSILGGLKTQGTLPY